MLELCLKQGVVPTFLLYWILWRYDAVPGWQLRQKPDVAIVHEIGIVHTLGFLGLSTYNRK